jgi:hypothetical protein
MQPTIKISAREEYALGIGSVLYITSRRFLKPLRRIKKIQGL